MLKKILTLLLFGGLLAMVVPVIIQAGKIEYDLCLSCAVAAFMGFWLYFLFGKDRKHD